MSLKVSNVRLPASDGLSDILCSHGIIDKISPAGQDTSEYKENVDGGGCLVIPSLCHAHIHLDKCYILDRCELKDGSFKEALAVTSRAKEDFTLPDLVERGRRLIQESIAFGVTSMRAHVEVDTVVDYECLEAGLQLREEFSGICDVRIAVFAQDPLFDDKQTEACQIFVEAARRQNISAIGSAPYVESSESNSKSNIDLILALALQYHRHADFHLDYSLSPSSPPLIYYLISHMRSLNWPRNLRVTIGHATRLTLFSDSELRDLRQEIGDLPISFVGLPQSDLYMMGRSSPFPRGTLRVTDLVEVGIDAALAVNNVGNAFTPQGAPDPLSLLPLGVAIYQAGSAEHCRILLNAITSSSKRAIGANDHGLEVDAPADLILLHSNTSHRGAIMRPSVDRTVISSGRVVAKTSLRTELFP